MATYVEVNGELLPTLGFTGTRQGMTIQQQQAVRRLLSVYQWGELHHGDCMGADMHAHHIAAYELGIPVVIHPPASDSQRAHCHSDRILPARPYLDRNRDIVDATLGLLACPGEPEEQLRSGTWSTVRYARKQGKPVMLVPPDGKVDWDNIWLKSA